MLSNIGAFDIVANALSVADLRQQVYANNIANASTPGYKRESVSFETALSNALDRSGVAPTAQLGQKSIPIPSVTPTSGSMNWSGALTVTPQIVSDPSTTVNNNGNNVDVNAEMASLAENQIRYNGLTQDLQMRIQRLQTAITG